METIIAAFIGAAATIISTLITVRSAKMTQPKQTVSPKSVTIPADHMRLRSISDTRRHRESAPVTPILFNTRSPHVKFWLVSTLLLAFWLILSPVTINGILVAPNMVIVIPAVTLLVSFLWPIWSNYAVIATMFLHTINLFMSIFFHQIWEKDQTTGALVSLAIFVLNSFLVSLITSRRLRRSEPSNSPFHL